MSKHTDGPYWTSIGASGEFRILSAAPDAEFAAALAIIDPADYQISDEAAATANLFAAAPELLAACSWP